MARMLKIKIVNGHTNEWIYSTNVKTSLTASELKQKIETKIKLNQIDCLTYNTVIIEGSLERLNLKDNDIIKYYLL